MTVDPYSPPRAEIDADSAHQPIESLRHRQHGPFIFGASYLASSWTAAGVAVYIFGLVEEVLGRGGTFQALLIASALASISATVAFGLTSAATGRFAVPIKAAILGLMAAAVIPIAFYLYRLSIGSPPSFMPALLLTAGIGALAAFSNRRVEV